MSRSTLARAGRFSKNARAHGVPLILRYAGAWTQDSLSKAVTRKSGVSIGCFGFITFAEMSSAHSSERLRKYGMSFDADGTVVFPAAAPVDGLVSVEDRRQANLIYDVTVPLPAEIAEGVFNAVMIRTGLVYNKRVRVEKQGPDAGAEQPVRRGATSLIFFDVPARIVFAADTGSAAGGLVASDVGSFGATNPYMEIPNVYDSNGVLIRLEEKTTIVTDDPVLYGERGPIQKYRLGSSNLDPGGEKHHQRYLLGSLGV